MTFVIIAQKNSSPISWLEHLLRAQSGFFVSNFPLTYYILALLPSQGKKISLFSVVVVVVLRMYYIYYKAYLNSCRRGK